MKTVAEIAQENDAFRKSMRRDPRHQVVVTESIESDGPLKEKLIEAVRGFDSFTTGNDPHGEHDFGQVKIENENFFFKIDYYDLNFEYGGDPAEEEVARVLTIMRASEY